MDSYAQNDTAIQTSATVGGGIGSFIRKLGIFVLIWMVASVGFGLLFYVLG